jgi:hypothetical protein
MRSPSAPRLLCVLLSSLLVGPAPARAADDEPPLVGQEFIPPHILDPDAARALARATEKSAPVVVVSGGISLGAYQAGFISTLVRFWSVARREGGPRHLGDPMPRVWTGASAGAVNALLGGLSSCDSAFAQRRWNPEQSLFWRVWIDRLDLDALLPREDDDRGDHLFSDPYMGQTLQVIAEEAAQPDRFRDGCSFAFGLTVTNLEGRDVPFGSGAAASQSSLKRVTEKLVAQVMTHGTRPPTARLPYLEGDHLRPYIRVDRDELPFYPALGTQPPPGSPGGQPVSLTDLLLTPRASGAFPLAFPPVPLSVSFFDETRWKPVQTLKLVDGGVLNNNPLDLAARLGRHWMEQEADGSGEMTLDAARFPIVYLDQDVVDWRWKERAPPDPKTQTPLEATYFQHLGHLLAAAQDNVVLDTLEHDPALSGRVKIPRRSTVLPSEFRFAMMGFFDRRFREHDFFRGMHDAIRFLATQFSTTRPVESLAPASVMELPWDREARIRAVLGVASEKFRCVEDGACDASDELFELGRLRNAADELTHQARAGELEPDQVDALLGALRDAGYRYAPGVMDGALASGTRRDFRPVRERVGKAFHDLVTHQPGGLTLVLRPAGAAFLDRWLTYTAPRRALTLQLSRQGGVGVGLEAPVAAFEDRHEPLYDRAEWRLGASLSGFGVRDRDQNTLNSTRVRWATLGAYVDWVSDLDGFSGALPALALGPYVRWRAGVGVSGSYLSAPREWSLLLPELRLGMDLSELVGLRLSVPVYLVDKTPGAPVSHGRPKFFKEAAVGVQVLLTRW